MNEEKNYSNNTERENLRRLIVKKQSVDERMYAVIRELIRPIAAIDGITADEATSLFFSTLELLPTEEADYPIYEKNNSVTERTVRLTACVCFDELTGKKRKISDYFRTNIQEAGNGIIAYSKNTLSDRAYKVFAKHVTSARVLYPSDFTAVCEAVYYEKAEYCILPLENSTDGRLSGFYNLISKYELFVCMCTDIYNAEGDGYTRFALCKKEHFPIIPHKKDTHMYGEFMITPNDNNSVCDILFGVDYLGARVVKADCVPAFGDSEYCMYVTLDCNESELFRVIMYFSIEQIRYLPVGVYSIV